MRRYLTLRQVAERLGKRPHWMYRNVKDLIAEHGFPARDAAMGGWDELAIARWQDARLSSAVIATPSEARGKQSPAGDCRGAPAERLAMTPEEDEDVDVAAELDRRARSLFKEAS